MHCRFEIIRFCFVLYLPKNATATQKINLSAGEKKNIFPNKSYTSLRWFGWIFCICIEFVAFFSNYSYFWDKICQFCLTFCRKRELIQTSSSMPIHFIWMMFHHSLACLKLYTMNVHRAHTNSIQSPIGLYRILVIILLAHQTRVHLDTSIWLKLWRMCFSDTESTGRSNTHFDTYDFILADIYYFSIVVLKRSKIKSNHNSVLYKICARSI